MNYDLIETSTAEGQPYFLYLFAEGAQAWRFTSRAGDWVSPAGAIADETANLTWTASAVSHGSILQSSDLRFGHSVFIHRLGEAIGGQVGFEQARHLGLGNGAGEAAIGPPVGGAGYHPSTPFCSNYLPCGIDNYFHSVLFPGHPAIYFSSPT